VAKAPGQLPRVEVFHRDSPATTARSAESTEVAVNLHRKRAPSRVRVKRRSERGQSFNPSGRGVAYEQVLMIIPTGVKAEDRDMAAEQCFGCMRTSETKCDCHEGGVFVCADCANSYKLRLCRNRPPLHGRYVRRVGSPSVGVA